MTTTKPEAAKPKAAKKKKAAAAASTRKTGSPPTPPPGSSGPQLRQPNPRGMGRPSTYNRAKVDHILHEMATTGRSMTSICNEDEGMPFPQTFLRWVEEDIEGLSERYHRAREQGCDVIAAQCLEIADTGVNDWMEKNDPGNPGYALNGEHVQRSKLRVETRLKLLAKWSKRYSDRQEIAHTGNVSITVATGIPHAPGQQDH